MMKVGKSLKLKAKAMKPIYMSLKVTALNQ